MQPPRTVDDLLTDARVLPPDDDLAEEEAEWASRRFLAEDYADAVRRRGAAGGGFPLPALGPGSLGLAGAGHGRPAPVPRREEAARELRLLSAWTIRAPCAVQHIAGLATSHQIDPDSAQVFACLLHLADRDDRAEPLWQFAAGAGKAASAECLFLLHTTRGELRQARHWAHEANDLDADDTDVPAAQLTSTERIRTEPRPLTSLMLLRAWRTLRDHDLIGAAGGKLTIEAFHACAGTLSRGLTAAIQGLKAEPGTEFGLLSWPDHALADRMQECLVP